jgi:hypothetical protein
MHEVKVEAEALELRLSTCKYDYHPDFGHHPDFKSFIGMMKD